MPLDWDKLRVFHAAAQAGSFTQAGEKLHISQSAVSRQVSALESDIGAPLFNRHARGLVLTEQGELLFRTAHDVYLQLENVKARLVDTTDKPSGTLRITTTVGLGSGWLTYRVQEFLELGPVLGAFRLRDGVPCLLHPAAEIDEVRWTAVDEPLPDDVAPLLRWLVDRET